MKEVFLRIHEKTSHSSYLELGTIISADPLVISLDLEPSMQLEFNLGDFVMNDLLVLAVNDRVILSRMLNPHLYVVLCRIRGKLGTAVIGSAATAVAVARVGDTIVGTGTDPQGGTVNITGTITSGSTKMKVE